MQLFGILCVCLAVAGVIENALHMRALRRISIRVQVNGTRGKSTTTRLIAAGLRAGGHRVVAKTTGTAPTLILEDGSERPIVRRGPNNISEQMKIARLAARRGADALVLECMALEPENQWVAEHRMVRSTIGVITNVRDDHLDVMGPTIGDVASALSHTVPRAGHLVTAEREFLPVLCDRAARMGTQVHAVDGSEVSDDVNGKFGYVSFKENVACALRACELAGVPRDVALSGMLKAQGDPGAMRILKISRDGHDYVFAGAFAANDHTSTSMIWQMLVGGFEIIKTSAGSWCASLGLPLAIVMNNRADRMMRIGELAPLVSDANPAYVFLIGQSSRAAARSLEGAGLAAAKIQRLSGLRRPEDVFDAIARKLPDGALLFGIGNTKGMGQEFTDYYERNGGTL